MIGRAAREPIVITGIGMLASLGKDREALWQALCRGESGVRSLRGVRGLPDDMLLGACVEGLVPACPREAKVITLCRVAAGEAITDAQIDFAQVDRDRFGCAISGHMGDTGWIERAHGWEFPAGDGATPWWEQWMPNSACAAVANLYGLRGPRTCHSVACASGLVDILAAYHAIRDGQCDLMLAGSAEAIHPLIAAGFHEMRVLARHDDPRQASRPFDRQRNGFVMGEGSAMFVLERLSHAEARGARIYAEIASGKMAAEAHHVTSMNVESEALAYTIRAALGAAGVSPGEVGYINAHGTATQQNDAAETWSIRQAFGPAARDVLVSSTKSMIGHLVNAAGSVELGVTALSLRDGFAPPTINLTDPDPACDLDYVPLAGREVRTQHALKLSVAFGGHLVAVVLRRWEGAASRTALPVRRAA